MKNIVINAVFLHEKARGVGRASNNLLKKIAELDKTNQYYVIYGKWQDYDFLDVKQDNFHFIPLNIGRNAIIRNIYLAFILPFKVLNYNPAIYHIMDTSPVFFTTCPTISTIHDLAEFTVPEKYNPLKCWFRKRYVGLQIKKSNMVITVSEYTKQDMIKRFHVASEKVKVLYNFFESNWKFESNRAAENYFLVVGEIERTKNVPFIIEAFSKLPEAHRSKFRLKIVGRKGNDFGTVKQYIERFHVTSNVDLYDYVTDDLLFELYKNAYSLVFASLFEGFGLPVLEAMTFGVPVLCSGSTSLPEVIGDAGIIFDERDNLKLRDAMIQIIENPEHRTHMIEKGFLQIRKFDSMDITKKLLDIYQTEGHWNGEKKKHI